MAFNGRFLLNLMHFAQKQGADINQLMEISGHSYEELCQEDFTVGSEVYNRVVEQAVEFSGDEFFGMHAGESLNLTAAGLIAQITQSSATVKEALDYCCEFAQLGCSSLPMTLTKEGAEYKLLMVPEKLWNEQSTLSVKHTVDGFLVFTIREYHSLTRNIHYPLRIELPYNKPSSTSEYERLMGCPVLFNRDEIAIYFSAEQVEAPVITSDYNLLRVLVEHARNKLDQIEKQAGYAELVKESIINLVKPSFPTIQQVASHLNISVRTLQRKLLEEGLTYKEIMSTLRHEFAISYLRNPQLSINEISYLLSYNEASSFIRSFRKITGKTPKEYREELFAGSES